MSLCLFLLFSHSPLCSPSLSYTHTSIQNTFPPSHTPIQYTFPPFLSHTLSLPFIRTFLLPHRPNVDLIGAMETQSEPSELELDDVVITNPHIEAILENEDWIEDASGLVSHCISILKVMSTCCTPCMNTLFSLGSNSMIFTHSLLWQICHTLTEKLVAMTMGSGAKVKAPASLSDIITVAKRISPRVDDVVRSMYPPLDPILLDARATALLLSVSHLVLVTRNACHMSGSMDWIDQSLHAAEDHMVVLREAALASEPERSLPGIDVQREQAI
uniref:Transmembrane protein 98 n=1 Tax=Oncorhynchus tshawytscha TaxID=74940 RepID=A0AAZ3PY64_ONCTS